VTLPDNKTQLVDKYLLTAGRMRAFIERTNGNLKKFIEDTKPKEWWQPAWTAFLPSNMEEALFKLGPYPADGFTRQGCVMAPGGGGARTYWQPPNNPLYPDEKQPYSKDVLDDKALNCVEFFTMMAFCIWDGGHLAHSADLVAAWGPASYPWGETPIATQASTTASRSSTSSACASKDRSRTPGRPTTSTTTRTSRRPAASRSARAPSATWTSPA
jgi:hypothetical protein